MFQSSELKVLQLFDNNRFCGLVKYNPNIYNKAEMIRPFIRTGKREILSIGRVNYAYLDNFIMKSLNDIYTHLNEGKDPELKRQKIVEYQELYSLWQKIAVARQNNDLNISSYYDDLVYRLYLKGYQS